MHQSIVPVSGGADKSKHDPFPKYVHTAITKDYAVLAVNVPYPYRKIAEPDDAGPPMDQPSCQLADYLWSNYIERSPNDHVFVIGMGEPYRGWMHMLSSRANFSQMVSGSVAFVPSGIAENSTPSGVNVPVVGLTREHDDTLQRWFYQHSQHFVGHTHAFWERPRPSRRFGRLVKSPETRLQRMLEDHHDEVFQWIEDQLS